MNHKKAADGDFLKIEDAKAGLQVSFFWFSQFHPHLSGTNFQGNTATKASAIRLYPTDLA
jgi:hypothetical protein